MVRPSGQKRSQARCRPGRTRTCKGLSCPHGQRGILLQAEASISDVLLPWLLLEVEQGATKVLLESGNATLISLLNKAYEVLLLVL